MPPWGAGRKANKTSDRALMRKSFVVSGLARRRSLAVLFAAAALLLRGPAASPGAGGFTAIKKGAPESFAETACGGAADVTITYNAVFHVTVLDNGTYHLTGSNAGTI